MWRCWICRGPRFNYRAWQSYPYALAKTTSDFAIPFKLTDASEFLPKHASALRRPEF